MAYVLKTNYADKSNYGAYRSVSKIKYIQTWTICMTGMGIVE